VEVADAVTGWPAEVYRAPKRVNPARPFISL
jgi:hypothetical protein